MSDRSEAERAESAAGRFDKLVAIVGPPRSGTTIVTAVLSVLPETVPVYEPWNDNKRRIDSDARMDFTQFLARFVPPEKIGRVLLVKETATDLRYLRRVDELLATAPAGVDARLVVILRNPFHVFLSEVQARREWWGDEELELDAATFARWARRMLESCRILGNMAREHDSILLFYDRFSGDPDAVAALTRMLGLEPHAAQAAFERHLDRRAVRGDQRVARDPRPITAQSVQRREAELTGLIARLSDAAEYAAIERLGRAFATLPSLARARLRSEVIEALRGR